MQDSSSLPSEFFEPASLITLGSAALVVLVVTTALRKVFGLDAIKTSFVVSVAVTFVGLVVAEPENWVVGVVVAFFNACLLFCTVTGLHEYATATRPEGPQPHGRLKMNWSSAWARKWL